MVSFEQELKEFLTNNRVIYTDNTSSKTLIDFEVQLPSGVFHMDAKEKRQKYSSKWTDQIPEEFVFLIDEDAVIKSLRIGLGGGVLVRDKRDHNFYFFSNIDLLLMPKTRIKRPLSNGTTRGKWVVDLRNAFRGLVLGDVIEEVNRYMAHDLKLKGGEPYKEYFDEVIEERGSVRKKDYMDHDFQVTR